MHKRVLKKFKRSNISPLIILLPNSALLARKYIWFFRNLTELKSVNFHIIIIIHSGQKQQNNDFLCRALSCRLCSKRITEAVVNRQPSCIWQNIKHNGGKPDVTTAIPFLRKCEFWGTTDTERHLRRIFFVICYSCKRWKPTWSFKLFFFFLVWDVGAKIW